MIKLEKYSMPAASMGTLNPMPDIKNISYIHAGYEMTEKIKEEEKEYIGKGMIPTMLPYKIQDGYNREKTPTDFDAAILENDYLKVVFLPSLGGRLWSVFDKRKNKELLYVNPVFQPGNLGLRNAWFSGGVEFNVGIKGHNPLTCSPLWCAKDTYKNGDAVLRLYEYERIRGVVYSISAYLPDDSDVLYLKCKIENKTNETKHMYWWSNIAVPETSQTRVLVPADDSFLCFYNADHYVLDKAEIPSFDGIDVSYPGNIPSSRDFFYKIPEKNHKWIATANEEGFGLLQCSTRELIGRKLFVWGMNPGGRQWNEWLSEENSAYIEIQAGLAHTQLEHIPMTGNTTWEWIEAYTALDRDALVMHGNYQTAVDDIENYMISKVGNPDEMAFPDDNDKIKSEIIFKGSDWGAIEEMKRGEKISDSFVFPKQNSTETEVWTTLLKKNTFSDPDVLKEPESYVTGDFWLKKLENLPEKGWFAYLHIGVIKYASGDINGSKEAWEKSCDIQQNPWALRNLSMLYKNEFKELDKAREYMLSAFEFKKDHPVFAKELAMQLTADGNDALWLEFFDTLPENLKKIGRLRLYRAIALLNLGRLDEATEIMNENFVMSDIKEGELSVSHYWFELYRRIYARETGKEYNPDDKDFIKEADKKYPLPKSVDFRMHD